MNRRYARSLNAHNAQFAREERTMLKSLLSIFRKEEGQSLVEYALIIALVAVVLIASLQALQGGITAAFNNVIASH